MPDDRTQDALDALADLFLTGLDPAAAPRKEGVAGMPGATGMPGADAGSASRSAAARAQSPSPVTGPLDGPEPIRLGPKLQSVAPASAFRLDVPAASATHAGSRAQAHADGTPPFDDWTLGVDEANPAEATSPTAAPETPYLRLARDIDVADEIASAHTADADADADELDLSPSARDPVAVDERPSPADAARLDRRDADDNRRDDVQPDDAAILVEAVLLGALPGLSGPWLTQYAQWLARQEGPVALLHVDDAGIDLELVDPVDSPTGRSPAPPRDLLIALETLLNDPDQPLRAILVHLDPTIEPASLKRLLALDQWTFLCGADDLAVVGMGRFLRQVTDAVDDPAQVRRKQVGLMVMGGDATHSRAAAGRIQSAAADLFDEPVRMVGWQKRMQPVRVRQGGTYDHIDSLWPRIEALLRRYGAPTLPPAMAAPPLGAPPTAQPRPEPRRATQMRPDKVAAATRTPSLFDLVAPDAIPGGVALQARCPHHPRTELALDQAGRLHLLHHHERPAGAADDMHALQAAALELLEARRWVREHLALLSLTQRQLQFDPQAAPSLHLFTPRADLGSALAGRLGDTLKLHLLQQVRVGDAATWFCTPLS